VADCNLTACVARGHLRRVVEILARLEEIRRRIGAFSNPGQEKICLSTSSSVVGTLKRRFVTELETKGRSSFGDSVPWMRGIGTAA